MEQGNQRRRVTGSFRRIFTTGASGQIITEPPIKSSRSSRRAKTEEPFQPQNGPVSYDRQLAMWKERNRGQPSPEPESKLLRASFYISIKWILTNS